jgi:hypothetical protein
MAAQAPALAEGTERQRGRMRAALGEWLFLTEVYRYSEDDARRQMGEGKPGGYLSERTMFRYKRYLAEHPEVRLELLDIYTDEEPL